MLEPSVAFQTAVRAALVADERLIALVEPQNIRFGQGRPDTSPCVILGDAPARYLSHGGNGQHVARVYLTLHIWIRHDWGIGQSVDTAKAIGSMLLRVLAKPPDTGPIFEIDAYHAPHLNWIQDPTTDLAWMHGLLDLDAVLRRKT